MTTAPMTQGDKAFRIALLRDLIRLMRNRDADGQSSHAIDAMEIVAQILEDMVTCHLTAPRYYAAQMFADTNNETVRVKPLLLKEAANAIEASRKPVAWRHRHIGSNRWIYTDDEPTGPSIHTFEVEPLCSLSSQLNPGEPNG